MITIPPYALLIFGKKFGGWYWPSITPKGRLCYWLAFYELGVNEMRFVRLNSLKEIECYCDAMEEFNPYERD